MVSNAAEIFPVWLNCHFRETQHRASEALACVYYWTISTISAPVGAWRALPGQGGGRAEQGLSSDACLVCALVGTGPLEMSLGLSIKGRKRACLSIPYSIPPSSLLTITHCSCHLLVQVHPIATYPQSLSFNQQQTTSRCVPPSSTLLLSPPLRPLSL
jgi:hypothetical protein